MVSREVEVIFLDSMHIDLNTSEEFSRKIANEIKGFDDGIKLDKSDQKISVIGENISDGALRNSLKYSLVSSEYDKNEFDEIVGMLIDHLKVKFNVRVLC